MPELQDCPDVVFSQILIKAASADWRQFNTLRGLCSGFREVPKMHVYKNVCLEIYPHFHWANGLSGTEWFKLCVEAENEEALLRKALESFGFPDEGDSWRVDLKPLMDRGYKPATYAYGVLCLFYGNREAGLESLWTLMATPSEGDFRKLIGDYRKKSLTVLSPQNRPWYFQLHPLQDPRLLRCKCKPQCMAQTLTQSLNPHKNMCTCYDSCFWDHESALVTRGDAFLPGLGFRVV